MSEIKIEIEIGSPWLNKCDGLQAVVASVGNECIGFNQVIDGKKYFYTHTVAEFTEYYSPLDMVNEPPHYKDASGIDDTFNDDITLQTFSDLMVGKMRLIGIAGQARSGKGAAASYLLSKLGDGWSIVSFADPMKAMLDVIGVDCSDAAKDLPKNQYGVSTRHMLQSLGTEWGRDGIGSNFWIDVFKVYNAGQCVIVPDVRFENEAELIREHGLLICIEGRGGIEGGHISERKLQYDDRDIYIDNRGSLSELYEKLDSIDFDSE